MKFKELCAVLIFYRSNFENLHWNSIGEDFNDSHKSISTEYYELLNKYVDIVAEMLTRLGVNPPNITEVISIVNTSENKYMIVDSNTMFNRTDIVEKSQVMLEDIVHLIVNCLESEEMSDTYNAGIKSTLESMLEEFDIQYRYINKRRLKYCCNAEVNNDSEEPEQVDYEY